MPFCCFRSVKVRRRIVAPRSYLGRHDILHISERRSADNSSALADNSEQPWLTIFTYLVDNPHASDLSALRSGASAKDFRIGATHFRTSEGTGSRGQFSA